VTFGKYNMCMYWYAIRQLFNTCIWLYSTLMLIRSAIQPDMSRQAVQFQICPFMWHHSLLAESAGPLQVPNSAPESRCCLSCYCTCACRLSQQGIEDVLDIIADIDELPPSFRESIANNHRALLTGLQQEWGIDCGYEVVYRMCPECGFVFRHSTEGDFTDPDIDECPKCCAPCYTQDSPDGKKRPRMQVCKGSSLVGVGQGMTRYSRMATTVCQLHSDELCSSLSVTRT
jgi:hypothetical protein